ncbi:MAG TPA: hypothetical protein VLG37_02885 [Candidatus Saccharimonadales bacterium]|nr:hypothetical protein [Candidatus Saccharimonadales bacterium]
MGKYIWPHQISEAAYWYLCLLREASKATSLDELLSKIDSDPFFGVKPSRRQVQRQLYRFVKNGLIERHGSHIQSRYSINTKGLARLEQLSFAKEPLKPVTWDGLWRLVIFDIPEVQREARYHIRRLLKELGFAQLQLSVWIHPLPLLSAFKQIQQAYGIQERLHMLEVINFKAPKLVEEVFRKRYPDLLN